MNSEWFDQEADVNDAKVPTPLNRALAALAAHWLKDAAKRRTSPHLTNGDLFYAQAQDHCADQLATLLAKERS